MAILTLARTTHETKLQGDDFNIKTQQFYGIINQRMVSFCDKPLTALSASFCTKKSVLLESDGIPRADASDRPACPALLCPRARKCDPQLPSQSTWLDLDLVGLGLGWTCTWLDLYFVGLGLGWTWLDLDLVGLGLGWTWTLLDLDLDLVGLVLGWTWTWLDV